MSAALIDCYPLPAQGTLLIDGAISELFIAIYLLKPPLLQIRNNFHDPKILAASVESA